MNEAHAPAASAEQQQQLYAFVAQEMKAGRNEAAIAEALTTQGVEAATEVVNKLYLQILEDAKREQFTGAALVPAILGGSLAALASGYLWGVIAVNAGYEVGYVAWGIGFLAGFVVVLASGGKKGLLLQMVAVSSATAGILFGKYYTFVFLVQEALIAEGDAVSAKMFTLMAPQSMILFGLSLPEMLGGFDLLWLLLALTTAWAIPKSLGIPLDKHERTTSFS